MILDIFLDDFWTVQFFGQFCDRFLLDFWTVFGRLSFLAELDRFLDEFWTIFGQFGFLDDLRQILGRILDSFLDVFGQFLNKFIWTDFLKILDRFFNEFWTDFFT